MNKRLLGVGQFIFLWMLSFYGLNAQVSGLGFNGQEVGLDQRTELNLTPDNPFEIDGELEIDFQFMIKPSIRRTYGYVLRLVDQNDFNIDILSLYEDGQFNLCIVHKMNDSVLNIPIKESQISEYIPIRLKLLVDEQKLVLYTPDSFYVVGHLPLRRQNEYRMSFGASSIPGFCTTDTPSMSIKDVKVIVDGRVKHSWLLDEESGNEVVDKVGGAIAYVKSPLWLRNLHSVWSKLVDFQEPGSLVVANDNQDDRIFFIGEQQMKIFSMRDNNIKVVNYTDKPDLRINGCQAVYDPQSKQIVIYDIDEKQIFTIDLNTGRWDGNVSKRNYPTTFLHHNRVLNTMTNELIVLGGYGRHAYKNSVQVLNLDDNTHHLLNAVNNGVYTPRYLAGSGFLNDTIYIFGGYGSETGNQMINPHSSYDLISFSITNKVFAKKHEVKPIIPDMCVANSLYIDKKNRSFYALAFRKVNTNGILQLLKGSLDGPEIQIVGSSVPYSFFDINSYADLIYSNSQNKLYAVTTYQNNEDLTNVEVYSINYPPSYWEGNSDELGREKKGKWLIWILFISVIVLLIAIMHSRYGLLVKLDKIFIWKSKQSVGQLTNDSDKHPLVQLEANLENAPEVKLQPAIVPEEEKEVSGVAYNIIFFGGFQVFSCQKEDVTSGFTPLLKELFLLLWLYTHKNNKGITSDKIIEKLWPDKTEKSARNNIAVNLAKLRTLLVDIGDVELSRKTGYWKIILNDPCLKSDYLDFLNLTESKVNLNEKRIERLIEILSKGAFLQNVEYEWLDDFKAMVSDRIIETMVSFTKKQSANNPELNLKIANCIFNFDVINEEALIMKCKAQYLLGQHGLAKKTYESFIKEYALLYGEEYQMTFNEIVT